MKERQEKRTPLDKLSIIMWLDFSTRTMNKQSIFGACVRYVRSTCISLYIKGEYHFKIEEEEKKKPNNLMWPKSMIPAHNQSTWNETFTVSNKFLAWLYRGSKGESKRKIANKKR